MRNDADKQSRNNNKEIKFISNIYNKIKQTTKCSLFIHSHLFNGLYITDWEKKIRRKRLRNRITINRQNNAQLVISSSFILRIFESAHEFERNNSRLQLICSFLLFSSHDLLRYVLIQNLCLCDFYFHFEIFNCYRLLF